MPKYVVLGSVDEEEYYKIVREGRVTYYNKYDKTGYESGDCSFEEFLEDLGVGFPFRIETAYDFTIEVEAQDEQDARRTAEEYLEKELYKPMIDINGIIIEGRPTRIHISEIEEVQE